MHVVVRGSKKLLVLLLSFCSETLIVCSAKQYLNVAVICNTCGLPEDLCACGDLAKDSTKIIIRLETRRFRKKGTMIEGLDPKINSLDTVAKDLKNKYACGGTAKDGYIFLQGDHRDTIKDTLVSLGFAEDTIELH